MPNDIFRATPPGISGANVMARKYADELNEKAVATFRKQPYPSGVDSGGPMMPVAGRLGVTLLEWYAAEAMRGLLAAGEKDHKRLAKQAFMVAREMVAEMRLLQRKEE